MGGKCQHVSYNIVDVLAFFVPKSFFQITNKEDAMIHQTFLMDSEVLVRDVLAETGLRVHDFVRFEVGQSS